jgi:hypothetical protein
MIASTKFRFDIAQNFAEFCGQLHMKVASSIQTRHQRHHVKKNLAIFRMKNNAAVGPYPTNA